MSNSRSMGIGAMLIFLVVVVIVLPMVVKVVGNMETFIDLPADGGSGFMKVPAICNGVGTGLPTWRPDANTNYLCNSPNDDGQPCGEDMFCDGTTQKCVPKQAASSSQYVGYFS